MNADVIFELLQTAVNVFYMRDKRLIEIGGLERTCAARIAGYLQRMLDVYGCIYDLSVDCEYGKATDEHGVELRKYLDANGGYADAAGTQQGRVFPDIIVHKRGTHTNNLLVIELKGHWHNDNDWGNDEEKLKKFTYDNAPSENLRPYFRYELGVFVVLGKHNGHFVRFQDGRQVSAGDSVTDLFSKRSDL
ncbi:MAG: hypothetical protein K2L95_01075 [Alphaproteobacteria bacterium]|nr:hypothetical protein [Alphaproteobacteria bacterium]